MLFYISDLILIAYSRKKLFLCFFSFSIQYRVYTIPVRYPGI